MPVFYRYFFSLPFFIKAFLLIYTVFKPSSCGTKIHSNHPFSNCCFSRSYNFNFLYILKLYFHKLKIICRSLSHSHKIYICKNLYMFGAFTLTDLRGFCFKSSGKLRELRFEVSIWTLYNHQRSTPYIYSNKGPKKQRTKQILKYFLHTVRLKVNMHKNKIDLGKMKTLS